jgi:addiction module RelE/StbE family toxin
VDGGGGNRSERIADYLFSHAPERAPLLIRSIHEAPETLLSFPRRGRPGKKAGTRELVLSPLPWIVVYAVRDEVVHVVRILHGAQRWP